MTSITFFFIFIPILAIVLLAINLIFAPHNPYNEKDSAFECGFHSFLGQNRTQFSISFFIFALLFLLFDLEILLVYPYVVSAYVNGIYGLTVMLVFFLALTLGFAFELGKNALKIESRQSSTLDSNHTEINKVVGLKSTVGSPFSFMVSVLTRRVWPFLLNNLIIPNLVKQIQPILNRLANKWPFILDDDAHLKIKAKVIPFLYALVKFVVILYFSCLLYLIICYNLDFNSKGSSLEYVLSLNPMVAFPFFSFMVTLLARWVWPFLLDKFIMPVLTEYLKNIIFRLAVLWPIILDHDRHLKIMAKVISFLYALVKLVVILYFSYVFFLIIANILDPNSEVSSLEYGLSIIKGHYMVLELIFEWFLLKINKIKGFFGGDYSSTNKGQEFNKGSPGSENPGGPQQPGGPQKPEGPIIMGTSNENNDEERARPIMNVRRSRSNAELRAILNGEGKRRVHIAPRMKRREGNEGDMDYVWESQVPNLRVKRSNADFDDFQEDNSNILKSNSLEVPTIKRAKSMQNLGENNSDTSNLSFSIEKLNLGEKNSDTSD